MLMFLIIVFGLFALVLKLVDRPTIKKIKAATDTQSAIDYRKKLLHNRKTAFWIFVGVIVAFNVLLIILYAFIGTYYLKEEIDDSLARMMDIPTSSDIIGYIVGLILCIIVLFYYLKSSNKFQEIQGNVSTQSAKEFLAKNERFVLYLRGFESDVYNSKDVGKWDFSEDKLSKVIRKGLGIPMCAVGMTKEADCPIGGERVYVEDSTWEKDVYELMQKAEKIIIRVNDRTSCLWEISRSKPFIQKCSFLADDLSKYANARNKLSKEVQLPDIPRAVNGDLSIEYDPRSFFFSSDLQMKDFQGEIADYCEIAGVAKEAVTEEDIKVVTKTPFYQKPFFIALMIAGIFGALMELIELFRG